MRRYLLFLIISVILLGLLSIQLFSFNIDQKKLSNAPEAEFNNPKQIITIATGGVQGPYYLIGNALAQAFEKELGIQTSVLTSGGTVENMELMDSGKADLAFAMSDAVTFAALGSEGIKKMENFQALAGLYLNYVQIITLKGSPIQSVADLKGKRVGVGAPNSGVEVNARMVLAAFDLTYQDLQPENLSYLEAAEQLKKGQIDAAFVTSGLPNQAVTDLLKSADIKIIPIEPEIVEKLKLTYPFFQTSEIPVGTYRNVTPVPTVAIRNIMLVRKDLDDELVYRLTDELFSNLDLLQEAHEAMKNVQVEMAGKDSPIPLHPGAKRYFQEKITTSSPITQE